MNINSNSCHPLRIGAGSPGASQKKVCQRLQVKQICLYDKAIVPWEECQDVGEQVKNGVPDPTARIGEGLDDTDAKACTHGAEGGTGAMAQASAAASDKPGLGRWFVLKAHPHLGIIVPEY